VVSCRLGPGQDIRLRSVSRPEKHLAILLERLGLPLLNKPKKTQNVVETFATKMRIPSETQTSCLRTAENGFGFAPVQSSTMCLR